MAQSPQGWTDEQMEHIVGNLLRAGVMMAAAVVLAGGILYLVHFGTASTDYHAFHEEPADLRSPWGTVKQAMALHSHGLIQLGLLLLILTPVARVVFSVFAFARQRDWTYVVVTLIVLTVLLYSLFSGYL